MSEGGYISIPNWKGRDGFQHYGDRSPIWIRMYTKLLSDDDWLALSGHRRAVLQGLWLAYAISGCHLRDNTASLSRRLALKVTRRDLEVLNHAGFIDIVASKTLAIGYHNASLEEKREEKTKTTSSQVGSVASYDAGEQERPDPTSTEELDQEEELGADWEEDRGDSPGQRAQQGGYALPTLDERPNVESSNGMSRLSPAEVLASRAREGS